MSLVIIKKINIKMPDFLVINNLLRLKIFENNYNKKMYGFYEKDIKKEMSEEEIMDLQKKYKPQLVYSKILDSIKNNECYISIEKYLKKSKNEELLRIEIKENTFFTNGLEYWNITDIMRKYKISGKDVFILLTENNEYYNNLYDEKFKEKCDYVCFDYIKGYGIKNIFPKDIKKDKCELNIRKYNDRNIPDGYDRILKLIENRIDNNIVDKEFKKVEKSIKKPVEKPVIKYEKIINKIIDKKLGEEYNFMIKKDIINKMKKENNFMTNEFYNKYLKELGDELDLEKYFNYEKIYNQKYVFDVKYNTNLYNISIINILVFGKTRVNLYILDYLLEMVRTEFNSYGAGGIFDNYIIKDSSCFDKRYIITYHTDENMLLECKFYNDKKSKSKIAYYILMIMNETSPDKLNHHNYQILKDYYELYDSCNYLEGILYMEKERLKGLKL